MKKMNPEIKELWATALESGGYEQGTGQLRRASSNEFCCLGVLCDLFMRDSRVQGYDWGSGHFEPSDGNAPEMVCDWSGLEIWSGNGPQDMLVDMNDGRPILQPALAPCPFADIAAWIRANL